MKKFNLDNEILKQTAIKKKMFIRLYKQSKKEKNKELKNFCADVLETYERHNINDHIVWKG